MESGVEDPGNQETSVRELTLARPAQCEAIIISDSEEDEDSGTPIVDAGR